MVGLDLGGNSGNGIFQGENILELYKSRLMIERTLLSQSFFEKKEMLLIDRYLDITKARDFWKENDKLIGIRFNIPKSEFTLIHDSIISSVVKDIKKNYLIVERFDKKSTIASVKVTAPDELFAKTFAIRIVENVNAFYIQTKTKKALENVKILQKQADSVRLKLNRSIGGTASAIDANPNANPALQILRVPSQRRQIDVQANSTMYSEVMKNLEIAKIALRKETPLIQVIDEPVLPLERKKIGKLTGAILGSIIAVLFVVTALLLKRFFSELLTADR
jgi:hypothetical protein